MIFAFYLLGVLSGVILWEKIDMKTVLKGQIKLKQRGKGNTQLTEIKPKIEAKTERKESRKQKREQRKSK